MPHSRLLLVCAAALAIVDDDGVRVLTESGFDSYVAENHDRGVLVKFYAPWCQRAARGKRAAAQTGRGDAAGTSRMRPPRPRRGRTSRGGERVGRDADGRVAAANARIVERRVVAGKHCKELAPAFAEAARRLEGEIAFAKIDGTAAPAAAKAHGVERFPALKFFRQGRAIDASTGARDADGLVATARRLGRDRCARLTKDSVADPRANQPLGSGSPRMPPKFRQDCSGTREVS